MNDPYPDIKIKVTYREIYDRDGDRKFFRAVLTRDGRRCAVETNLDGKCLSPRAVRRALTGAAWVASAEQARATGEPEQYAWWEELIVFFARVRF